MDQRGHTLWVLGVGEAFKKAVRGAEDGKSHLRRVDEGGEAFVMAFAGFAEEHRLNAAVGTQGLFDEPHALDADKSILRGQPAAESHAELLQPAIVAASEERRLANRARVSCDFAWRSHYRGA